MYNPALVQHMRDELTQCGVKELKTPAEVDELLGTEKETILVVVNSVCGCAAGSARPAVGLALKNPKKPVHLTTVFAGQDKEATERARHYFLGYPPSSPSMVLMKDGKVAHMIHRHDIEGYSAEEIAAQLTTAFDKYC
jgi:putative YphP/YqiW family bacilliredoxin